MENNHTEWTLSRLDERGKELTQAIQGNYLNPERKAQVQHEISLIATELFFRHQEGELQLVKV